MRWFLILEPNGYRTVQVEISMDLWFFFSEFVKQITRTTTVQFLTSSFLTVEHKAIEVFFYVVQTIE